ncbi:bifunctional oligoribonuclease/PAP phosphatase NrnA [Kamptonema cortianum]|nr:bifunctional oligoribonuclease/PAP phosphatase NrnA [Oscillatoria laete-virens]MDK3157173.1 bifunctional oligoribonuclease/PAP phosphatase NrnA [Kamptonema cortianum]MDL5051149.1 bifunctional oligoribonuclease/PAP phosphatase NrnA [Oscillatoria amoena NRMC-F 0135]MDL5055055.1 bifunctional oligoribonuclease/PAP phosphatase NrnA [Oscillatoria laete-virens NRMC-F 0139]
MTPTLGQIAQELLARDHFLVMTHMRPDADALGSQLGLGLALEALGKKVTYWGSDPVPEKFFYLPHVDRIVPPDKIIETWFDCVVSIDCASFERLGKARHAIRNFRKTPPVTPEPFCINIDHHESNTKFGDLNHIDTSSPASGQIAYELLTTAGWTVTQEIATCLYAAISTDTGSFQYPNTTPKTMRVAADLIEKGVNVGEINRLIYESFPLRRLLLFKEVFKTAHFIDEGRIGYIQITEKMYEDTGAKPEDNENFIDSIRSVETVQVAALFEEEPEGKIRVSLRSKDPVRANVNLIAAKFGGGGHPAAAGARPEGTLQGITDAVIGEIRRALRA